MKLVRVFWVCNAARSGGEWVATVGAARRLANRLYADAATKLPGTIDCYQVATGTRISRGIVVSLLRGDGALLKFVGSVNAKPNWWRKSRDG